MACFLVPAAEAVVVTATYIAVKKKEHKIETPKFAEGKTLVEQPKKITWSRKLSWLLSMLWGGVLLLAFEHLWHGEIQPFAPFLTAMASKEATGEMLYEMSTVGVAMAACTTAVWGLVCAFVDAKFKQIKKEFKKQTA